MRALWIGSAALLTGCLATPGIHPTLHPSAPGTGTNGGIALGTAFQYDNQDESTAMQVGYGEGWVRIGPGGALELRSTPQAGFLSYELPITSGKTAVSIRPAVGFSIFRYSDTNSMGMSDSQTVMVLHPGGALVVNAGDVYVAPRLGVGISSVISGDGEGETAFSGGLTGGFRFGHGYSLELTLAYTRGEAPAMGDAPSAWTFVPSFGITVP